MRFNLGFWNYRTEVLLQTVSIHAAAAAPEKIWCIIRIHEYGRILIGLDAPYETYVRKRPFGQRTRCQFGPAYPGRMFYRAVSALSQRRLDGPHISDFNAPESASVHITFR